METIKKYWGYFVAGLVAVLGGVTFLLYKLLGIQKKKTDIANLEKEVIKEQTKVEEATKIVEVVDSLSKEQSVVVLKAEEAVKEQEKVLKDLESKKEVPVDDTVSYFNNKFGSK